MKILLITTKHCEACNIAEKNIKQAMSQSSKKITLEVKDIAEMDKKFLKDNKITDFPTVVYIKDDVIKLVEENINISIKDWNEQETSWDFKSHYFINFADKTLKLESIYRNYLKYKEDLFNVLKTNEISLSSNAFNSICTFIAIQCLFPSEFSLFNS